MRAMTITFGYTVRTHRCKAYAFKIKQGPIRDPCTRAHIKLVTPLTPADLHASIPLCRTYEKDEVENNLFDRGNRIWFCVYQDC